MHLCTVLLAPKVTTPLSVIACSLLGCHGIVKNWLLLLGDEAPHSKQYYLVKETIESGTCCQTAL